MAGNWEGRRIIAKCSIYVTIFNARSVQINIDTDWTFEVMTSEDDDEEGLGVEERSLMFSGKDDKGGDYHEMMKMRRSLSIIILTVIRDAPQKTSSEMRVAPSTKRSTLFFFRVSEKSAIFCASSEKERKICDILCTQ